MGYFKKLDYWSLRDGLEQIQEYCYNGNEKDSQYWDHYSELINDMSCIAADMWNELDNLMNKMDYQDLPWKDINFCREDESSKTAVAWFNTAVCMLSDIDMPELLEGEDNWDWDASWKEKDKRIKALERLTKKQQMYLFTVVIGFITRYLELRQAFDNIISLINELDYHQSFVINKDGEITPSEAAYL